MKTIVKEWVGKSNESSNATFKEFKSKKDAEKYIEKELRFIKVHSVQNSEIANFYEIL
ncbi:MAG: hypothetical protein ACOYO1_11205 [Bacteroidales bacterium]